MVTRETPNEVTVRVPDKETISRDAVIVAVPCDVTVPEMPENVPEFEPYGMVIVAGTGPSTGSEVVSETVVPPTYAA